MAHEPEQPVSITLPPQAWNVVAEGLTHLPYRIAASLLDEIRKQFAEATKTPEVPQPDAAVMAKAALA
ncbi:hypothetical protein OL599_17340 [Rhodovastum sp. RN2-1]|uniref:Uncharacterized protein n=1 Tax=Limobrevibacterium gyesilva TaxID=2991712 RepID=A0AA41YVV2_9PROT|nr:hypothetical protein [Limobrevibacterium gyesilva]